MWKTIGVTQATTDAPSQRIDATDRYEWMMVGFFRTTSIQRPLGSGDGRDWRPWMDVTLTKIGK